MINIHSIKQFFDLDMVHQLLPLHGGNCYGNLNRSHRGTVELWDRHGFESKTRPQIHLPFALVFPLIVEIQIGWIGWFGTIFKFGGAPRSSAKHWNWRMAEGQITLGSNHGCSKLHWSILLWWHKRKTSSVSNKRVVPLGACCLSQYCAPQYRLIPLWKTYRDDVGHWISGIPLLRPPHQCCIPQLWILSPSTPCNRPIGKASQVRIKCDAMYWNDLTNSSMRRFMEFLEILLVDVLFRNGYRNQLATYRWIGSQGNKSNDLTFGVQWLIRGPWGKLP